MFRLLSLSDLLLTFEAFFVGLGVSVWFRVCPWQDQMARLRTPARGARLLEPAVIRLAFKVGRAAERAGRWSPWSPRCLERALTAAILLRVRGIPCRLVVGVKAGEAFGAHAWLEVQGDPVVGRSERTLFQEMASWEL